MHIQHYLPLLGVNMVAAIAITPMESILHYSRHILGLFLHHIGGFRVIDKRSKPIIGE
jgi:hypothetical protein